MTKNRNGAKSMDGLKSKMVQTPWTKGKTAKKMLKQKIYMEL